MNIKAKWDTTPDMFADVFDEQPPDTKKPLGDSGFNDDELTETDDISQILSVCTRVDSSSNSDILAKIGRHEQLYIAPSGCTIGGRDASNNVVIVARDDKDKFTSLLFIDADLKPTQLNKKHTGFYGCNMKSSKDVFLTIDLITFNKLVSCGFATVLIPPHSKAPTLENSSLAIASHIKRLQQQRFNVYMPVDRCEFEACSSALHKLPVQLLPLPMPIAPYDDTQEIKEYLLGEIQKLTNNDCVSDEVAAPDEVAAALKLFEDALSRANDSTAADPRALWRDEVLQAMRLIFENSKPDWAICRYQLKNCKSIKLSDIESVLHSSEPSENIDDSSALIQLAEKHCTLAHDDDNEPYAILLLQQDTAAPVRQVWHVQSKSFFEWLSFTMYKTCGYAPSDHALKSAANALTGQAKFEGELISVHIRTAKHDGIYYIDLCNELWQAVAVSATGWTLVDKPPVYFTRSSSMRALPTPEKAGGNLEELWAFANIEDTDKGFVLAWLLEALRPDTAYPVLEICGEQGSAKSSTQSALRKLIDPNKSNLRAAPKNKDDVFVSAKNSLLVSYENLSHLTADYQDVLCTLSTGAGYAGRTLYTNGDETVIELKKPIVLNGIPTIVTGQDLLDRTIHIDAPMLQSTVTDHALDEQWERSYTSIFSGLLDLFSQTLAQLPSVDMTGIKLPRMADFTLLGAALYQAMGRDGVDFLSEYVTRRADGVTRTLDSSPVALAMIQLLEDEPSGFTGTVKGLLDKLEHYKEHSEGWIKSPKGLGDLMQRLSPSFRQIGIQLSKSKKRSSKGYLCTLKKEQVTYSQEEKLLKQRAQSTLSAPEVHQQPKSSHISTAKSAHGVLGEPDSKTICAHGYMPKTDKILSEKPIDAKNARHLSQSDTNKGVI